VEEKTDIQLVTLALGHDKNAFGELVRRYQSLAQGIARRLVGNEDSARDLVQESMLQAFLLLDRLKNRERFKSWLCGIVLNVCRNYLRDRKTHFFSLESLTGGQQFSSVPFGEGTASPIETAEEREIQNIVLQAVKELSADDQKAILSFYYSQLSLREIGAIYGVPVGTIKVRMFRARKKLKEKLLSLYPEIIPQEQRRKTMIKVTISDVVKKECKDNEGHSYVDYVVILHDEDGNRALPIWVGPFEGQSIAIGLTDLQFPRPLTFNFFANILSAIKAKVDQVRIETLRENTFYAIIQVSCGKVTKEIDVRPSDALALAIITNSPIFASEDVLQRAGIVIANNVDSEQSGLKDIINEIANMRSQRQAVGKQLSKEDVEKRNKDLVNSVFGSQ
jgi:RNA polymerase sigma factor (sigma-70 family)